MQGWIKLKQDILQSNIASNGYSTTPRSTITNQVRSYRYSSVHDDTSVSDKNGNDDLSSGSDEVNDLSEESVEKTTTPPVICIESSSEESDNDLTEIEPILIVEKNQEEINNINRVLSPISTASSSSVGSPLQSTVINQSITPESQPATSTRSTETSALLTEDISDDEIVLDVISTQKRKSIETLISDPLINLNIPFTTNFDNLPGNLDDLRDIRFFDYTDETTLSLHLQTCLSLDREASQPLQPYAKSNPNCLRKIFRLAFYKSALYRERSKVMAENFQKVLPLSVINSSTSISFKTDWDVNRRTFASKSRAAPRNFFHILELNPRKRFSPFEKTKDVEEKLDAQTNRENLEKMKNVLAKIYFPQFVSNVKNEIYFGSKSKFNSPQDLIGEKNEQILVKQPVESPVNFIENVDSSAFSVKDSIVVLSPTPIFSSIDSNCRKRKISKSTNSSKNLKRKCFTVEQNQNEENKSNRKKKLEESRTKKFGLFRKISRNIYDDETRRLVLASNGGEKNSICQCKPTETCEEGQCLNRIVFCECSSRCCCGAKCQNQRIRKGNVCKDLEVFSTGKYGKGVRATSTIEKGTFLCEYVGEVISENQFFDRINNFYGKEENHFAMKLTQNFLIDAYRTGNISRFVNHSCAANCEIQKWTVDGLPSLCLFASRRIELGEEINYDYQFHNFNYANKQPCYCGAKTCRRFLVSQRENHLNKKFSIENHRITEKEKKFVRKFSIFLLRNFRRVKEKQNRTKNFPMTSSYHLQNFYHRDKSKFGLQSLNLKKNPKISRKDLFALFYNHIRQSHFYKTGRIHHELIDSKSSFSQLVQLTLILEEIFDSTIKFQSPSNRERPSNLLKIVTDPHDLSTIKRKLRLGEYSTVENFRKEFLLIVKKFLERKTAEKFEINSVKELKIYFEEILRKKCENIFRFFPISIEEKSENLRNLEDFVERFHRREVEDGLVRSSIYETIFKIDPSTVVQRIVSSNNGHQRSSRQNSNNDLVVHCRCGSNFDETSLVQCFACQMWQHVGCVTIEDSMAPHFCFECRPSCDVDPSFCLKTNVFISSSLTPVQTSIENQPTFSSLTRPDGFRVRINESYFVPKQNTKNIDQKLVSPQFDILFVERLWIDQLGDGQASGFYYIRPNETFHEPTRKFFPNEVFRVPSSDDPLPIKTFVRPCFVVDQATFRRGRPINDNISQIEANDIFICDYRLDKSVRTFTKVNRQKFPQPNTKFYCFDRFIDPPQISRDYKHEKDQSDKPRPKKKIDKNKQNQIENSSSKSPTPSKQISFKQKTQNGSTPNKRKRQQSVLLSSDDEQAQSSISSNQTVSKSRKSSK